MTDNIILIGMPGVGKSSAGVVLAKVLGFEFLDSDLLIQREEKRLLKDIIAEDGNDAFLAIEERVNAGISCHHCIVATGGSVIYGPRAMEHLRNIGVVVYLKAGYDCINSRLSDLTGRGVAMQEGQSLKDLYEERKGLYEKYAHVVVEIDDLNITQTVQKIVEKLT